MTPETLLDDLAARGIVVRIDHGDIKLRGPAAAITDDVVAMLRGSKSDIIRLMKGRCRPHNNADNYVDVPAPNRPGWTRTTCRVCGRFIGYRREQAERRLGQR